MQKIKLSFYLSLHFKTTTLYFWKAPLPHKWKGEGETSLRELEHILCIELLVILLKTVRDMGLENINTYNVLKKIAVGTFGCAFLL